MAFSQSGQVLWNLVQRYNLRNCRTDLGPFYERNHFRSHFGQILLLAPELPRNEHTSQTNIVNRDRVRYFIILDRSGRPAIKVTPPSGLPTVPGGAAP